MYDNDNLSAEAENGCHPSEYKESQFLLMRSCTTGGPIEVTANFLQQMMAEKLTRGPSSLRRRSNHTHYVYDHAVCMLLNRQVSVMTRWTKMMKITQ